MGLIVGHALVEHDRLAGQAAHLQALIEGLAGLFEPSGGGDGVHDLDGDARRPRPVDVVGHLFFRLPGRLYGFDAGDVGGRIVAADLGRVGAVAGRPRRLQGGDHGLRTSRRDRAVERDPVAVGAAEQSVEGQSGGLAEDVPERQVEGRLGIAVAGQGDIHDPVEAVHSGRILADQSRCQQVDSSANTAPESRQVGMAPGATLAPSGDTVRRVDADEGAVQGLELEAPTGQPVGLI